MSVYSNSIAINEQNNLRLCRYGPMSQFFSYFKLHENIYNYRVEQYYGTSFPSTKFQAFSSYLITEEK